MAAVPAPNGIAPKNNTGAKQQEGEARVAGERGRAIMNPVAASAA